MLHKFQSFRDIQEVLEVLGTDYETLRFRYLVPRLGPRRLGRRVLPVRFSSRSMKPGAPQGRPVSVCWRMAV